MKKHRRILSILLAFVMLAVLPVQPAFAEDEDSVESILIGDWHLPEETPAEMPAVDPAPVPAEISEAIPAQETPAADQAAVLSETEEDLPIILMADPEASDEGILLPLTDEVTGEEEEKEAMLADDGSISNVSFDQTSYVLEWDPYTAKDFTWYRIRIRAKSKHFFEYEGGTYNADYIYLYVNKTQTSIVLDQTLFDRMRDKYSGVSFRSRAIEANVAPADADGTLVDSVSSFTYTQRAMSAQGPYLDPDLEGDIMSWYVDGDEYLLYVFDRDRNLIHWQTITGQSLDLRNFCREQGLTDMEGYYFQVAALEGGKKTTLWSTENAWSPAASITSITVDPEIGLVRWSPVSTADYYVIWGDCQSPNVRFEGSPVSSEIRFQTILEIAGYQPATLASGKYDGTYSFQVTGWKYDDISGNYQQVTPTASTTQTYNYKNIRNPKLSGDVLSWDTFSGAADYLVLCFEDTGSDYTDYQGKELAAVYTGKKTSINLKTMLEQAQIPAGGYRFRVKAVDSSGKAKTAETMMPFLYTVVPAEVPETATITSVKQTASGVQINWEKIPGIYDYYVYKKTGDTWAALGYSDGTSILDQKETLRKTYEYLVMATDQSFDPSESVSFTVTQFRDVMTPSIFYYQPVYWAVNQNITNGFSGNVFKPLNTCTRGEMVLFLWRLAGRPSPGTSQNPFTDISPSDTCYRAVLWAVGKGITNGYAGPNGTKIFKPDATCNRGDAVTFLWRYAGRPSVGDAVNEFSDVAYGKYYYKPVLWAAQKGITVGYSTKTGKVFKPEADCQRAHIVSFLKRYADL